MGRGEGGDAVIATSVRRGRRVALRRRGTVCRRGDGRDGGDGGAGRADHSAGRVVVEVSHPGGAGGRSRRLRLRRQKRGAGGDEGDSAEAEDGGRRVRRSRRAGMAALRCRARACRGAIGRRARLAGLRRRPRTGRMTRSNLRAPETPAAVSGSDGWLPQVVEELDGLSVASVPEEQPEVAQAGASGAGSGAARFCTRRLRFTKTVTPVAAEAAMRSQPAPEWQRRGDGSAARGCRA